MSQAKPTDAEIDKYAGHYVLHGCQSSALREAFPDSQAKAETTHVKASLFHNLDKVKIRVEELSEKARCIAEKGFKLDAEYVARRLKEIDELDVLDIMSDDLKTFKALSEWPKVWRISISGMDLVTLSSGDDDIESIVRKVKWPDKTKNLELIGKLTQVSAFSENLTIKSGSEVTPWGEVKASVDEKGE